MTFHTTPRSSRSVAYFLYSRPKYPKSLKIAPNFLQQKGPNWYLKINTFFQKTTWGKIYQFVIIINNKNDMSPRFFGSESENKVQNWSQFGTYFVHFSGIMIFWRSGMYAFQLLQVCCRKHYFTKSLFFALFQDFG